MKLFDLTNHEWEELSNLHESMWKKGEIDRFIKDLIKDRLFKYTQEGKDVNEFWRYTERI